MTSFAHIKLDLYDDPSVLSNRSDVPDYVKSTKLMTKEARAALPLDSFALVMVTQDGQLHPKFPVHSVGDTWMSLRSFEKNAHKLPLIMQETAAVHLEKAARLWSGKDNAVIPLIRKLAKQNPSVSSNFVTVTNDMEYLEDTVDKATEKFAEKVANLSSEDFALVVDGKGKYPLHNTECIKKACDWFDENRTGLQPKLRHEFANNLIKAASKHNYVVTTDSVFKYANYEGYADNFPVMIQVRKNYVVDDTELHLLNDVLEKSAELHPTKCAALLEVVDKRLGLDKYWDTQFADPYESVFAMSKLADYSYSSDAGSVDGNDLRSYVKREKFRESLESYMSKDIIDELAQNPVEVFSSLPKPEKDLVMSLMKE